MRTLTISILLLISTVVANAQFELKGDVKDASNQQPVIGASIYLPDLKKGTVTDEQGNFRIEDLPRGKFLIEVKYIGYASLVQTIEVQGDVQMNFILNSTITELHEIVISGVSHSTELKKNPISVVTMSTEALVKNNATNIIDNISQKPGISQITTGAAISKPVVRGLGYNRVIVLYDGVRQEGQQWGDEHGVEIDEFSVDRVEIIKGAGSLMYGSDGIGGVINFLAPNPVQEGRVLGQWISSFQSNNGLIANSVYHAGNIKGLYWSARVSQKAAKAYRNKLDGRVFNSGFKENDFNLLAGLNKSWGYTQLGASLFDQTIGLVEGERDALGNFLMRKDIGGVEESVTASENERNTYRIFIPRQSITHLRLSSNTNVFRGNSRMQLSLGYQKNLRDEFGNVLSEKESSLLFDLQTMSYGFIAYFPEVKGWNFSAGISGMAQQNKNRGVEFLIPEYRLWDWGIVSFVKKNAGKLDVAGGLRFDQRNLSIAALYLDNDGNPTEPGTGEQKFSAGDFTFSNYSASAGFAYQFSSLFSVKANVSRGFRAPTISELASNGRHEGSLRYEYGNAGLRAENSLQTDLSLLLNSHHVSAEMSLFQNTIRNYIFVKKLLAADGSDSIPDPAEPVPAYFYTQGKAQLRGAELSIDLHPHPLDWLHFENSFAIVYAENKSSTDTRSAYLPFTPAPRLQSEMRATAKHWRSFSNLFLKLQYQHHGKQERVLLENQTETPTSGYGLWHLGCGLDLQNKRQRTVASFYLTVMNVFDKAYQNHLSRLKYAAENPLTGRAGVFNMGRNYSLKLIVPLSFK